MQRMTIKVTGAQGQGVNSVGAMCAKGLKRAGYCIFGYREYMSLIKGGHSSYQLDVSAEQVRSSRTTVDLLVCFNHHGLEKNIDEVREGGVVLHQTPQWKFSQPVAEMIEKKHITIVYLPVEDILRRLRGKPILGNVLITAAVWAILGRKKEELHSLVQEQFGHKKDLLAQNFQCIDEGFQFVETSKLKKLALPEANSQWKEHLLITGSEAMGLGAVHAGVRLYAGYPMTPSSPLLHFMADHQNQTGMVIKQAEDEITAAQLVSGAMFMGTRALTATSGGGFDLMSETLSLNGMIENPAVFVLAQRPGPATGLPTWTAQADLLMAVHTAHGEFPRCVIAVSDAEDAFTLMPVAFNIAEQYQMLVIILTDKHVAEALFTQETWDVKRTELHRGKLVTAKVDLAKLKSTDRYDSAVKDGISLRWLPGAKAATYCAQGDEHNADGSVDETGINAAAQMEKRMKKAAALKKALPEPTLYCVHAKTRRAIVEANNPSLDLLLIGWGSTKGTVLDALASIASDAASDPKKNARAKKTRSKTMSIGYLHYTYCFPMKTERLRTLLGKAKKAILVEGNHEGQLGSLLQHEGIPPMQKILKYNGRPFFVDEFHGMLDHHLSLPK